MRELGPVEVLAQALGELRRRRRVGEVVRVRAEPDVGNRMRAGSLLDGRPGADRAGAVLAVRGEQRLERARDPDSDALPVAFMRLPETLACAAPVVELVEKPVPDEILRRREAGRRRRPRGNG